MLTQSMMIEKDVWNLISKESQEPITNLSLFGKEAKENRMTIGITQRIMKESISDQIRVNIMNLGDPKEMWNRLKAVCLEIGQEVVYLILQELLNYFATNKPKEFDKPVVEIFAKVRYLCKQLKAATIEGRDSIKTIAIVIALDTLHNDFDTTTVSMLEMGNKSIDEIFTIIQQKEIKLKSKGVTGNIDDAVLTFYAPPPKTKATYDNLYYNCH